MADRTFDDDTSPAADESISAGVFSQWLSGICEQRSADVACGSCNACCRSAYFIHIRADEHAALQAIPAELRFDAPGQAPGTQVMGYDQQGRCPMLRDGSCSIYAARPQTCRDYDCRLFAACGLAAGGEDKRDVNRRVAQWRFEYPTREDALQQQALTDAVAFLQTHGDLIGRGSLPTQPSEVALLAVAIFELFLPQQRGDDAATAARIRSVIAARIRDTPT